MSTLWRNRKESEILSFSIRLESRRPCHGWVNQVGYWSKVLQCLEHSHVCRHDARGSVLLGSHWLKNVTTTAIHFPRQVCPWMKLLFNLEASLHWLIFQKYI